MSWTRRFVQGPLTRFGIANGHRLLLALGGTWRVRHAGAGHVDEARKDGGAVLYAFSHGVLLPLAYTHRHRDVRLLISESRDGEVITRVTNRLGFGAVRGSTTRGGARAVLELAALGREGYDLAITPDGPRGPRGSVAPGVGIVAARAGLPIVPVGVAANRGWNARSWDRFLIPKPGARVWVTYGSPLRVERRADEHETDSRVEAAMADVEAAARRCAAGETPVGPVRRTAA